MNDCSLNEKRIINKNELKTKWVLVITLVTMVAEIIIGYISGSMALLADGWHMGSHALAMALSVLVYWLYRQEWFKEKFTFGGGKVLSLGGYTSAWFLVFMAIFMSYESVMRMFTPVDINYRQAMMVATIGLVINIICALILKDDHHHHDHHGHHHGHDHAHPKHDYSKMTFTPVTEQKHEVHDLNHQSAYYHILADAVTSLLAIVALFFGQKGYSWLDPLMGIIGGVLVLRWGIKMVKISALDLMDAHETSINQEKLKNLVEKNGAKVKDLHVWRLGPGEVACELVLSHSSNHVHLFKEKILKEFSIQHLVIQMDEN
jgi:cation diffusion facilitator family transporter